jgi:hypothetical protein
VRLPSGVIATTAFAAASLMAAGLLARGSSPPPPVPQKLADGVTLLVVPERHAAAATAAGFLPLKVTLANQGEKAIKVSYRDFSLTDGVGQRSPALLPAELKSAQLSTSQLLAEGTIPSGQSRSGRLYFRAPGAFVRPIDLRVDLESTDGIPVSQTFVSF